MRNNAAASPALAYGVAGRAMPGQNESGDGYVVVPCAAGTLVAVLDGLGHGPLAAAATRTAQAHLESHADRDGDDLATLVHGCHARLAGSRGVVMTLAFFSLTAPSMTWLGIGNVEGALLHAAPWGGSTRVVVRGGVVGATLPPLHSSTVTLTVGDLVILATDGIESRFAAKVDRQGEPAQITHGILAASAKNSDDALVLVARWE